MTKNITLRMDEDLLRKLKHIAVEHDMSLSAWISDLVRRAAESGAEMEYKKDKMVYDQAKSTVLKAMEEAVDYGDGGKTFSREELHER